MKTLTMRLRLGTGVTEIDVAKALSEAGLFLLENGRVERALTSHEKLRIGLQAAEARAKGKRGERVLV